jgi:hypothetical protein
MPSATEYRQVLDAATEDCYCTAAMRAGIIQTGDEMCKPCAARTLVNGIVTLAGKLARISR